MQLLAHMCVFLLASLLRQPTACRLTPALTFIVHIHYTMFNNIFKSAPATFAVTLTLALITIGAGTVHSSIKTLEAATAQQCANHEWPSDKHDIHIEWCLDNGYEV